MAVFFAFLHHAAAFVLVAALAAELVLIRSEMTVANARRILRVDAIYGMSASVLLVAGLLRVFYFEKGASYYFHSAPFIAKLSLFVIVGVASAYPTIRFLSWRKALREDRLPAIGAIELRAIRAILHAELAGIILILLFAALMARGIGYFG